MSILGQWYMQPGDIPEPYVFPLVLHPDGRAEWQGERPRDELYRVEGDKLIIGEDENGRTAFTITGDDILSGAIEPRWEPDGEDDIGGFSDSAALLRDPGKLEVC